MSHIFTFKLSYAPLVKGIWSGSPKMFGFRSKCSYNYKYASQFSRSETFFGIKFVVLFFKFMSYQASLQSRCMFKLTEYFQFLLKLSQQLQHRIAIFAAEQNDFGSNLFYFFECLELSYASLDQFIWPR